MAIWSNGNAAAMTTVRVTATVTMMDGTKAPAMEGVMAMQRHFWQWTAQWQHNDNNGGGRGDGDSNGRHDSGGNGRRDGDAMVTTEIYGNGQSEEDSDQWRNGNATETEGATPT